jgi:hypothetical protein
MEKPHGGNQNDALAPAPLPFAPLTHVGNRFDDNHTLLTFAFCNLQSDFVPNPISYR